MQSAVGWEKNLKEFVTNNLEAKIKPTATDCFLTTSCLALQKNIDVRKCLFLKNIC